MVSQINRMEHQHSYSKYELVNMASVRLKSPLRLTPDDMALSFELSCAVALSLLIGRMPGEWLKRKDRPCARLPPFAVRRTAGGFAARNTVPALYAWEPPSPRVRCLLACFTYLLTYYTAKPSPMT